MLLVGVEILVRLLVLVNDHGLVDVHAGAAPLADRLLEALDISEINIAVVLLWGLHARLLLRLHLRREHLAELVSHLVELAVDAGDPAIHHAHLEPDLDLGGFLLAPCMQQLLLNLVLDLALIVLGFGLCLILLVLT